jgi:hypothetical protein
MACVLVPQDQYTVRKLEAGDCPAYSLKTPYNAEEGGEAHGYVLASDERYV